MAAILILGGGVGGLVAANELRKKLGREHNIVLVDKSTKHSFAPSYLWVMMGWREPGEIEKELSLLNKKGIEYINAEVLDIDVANRLVKTSNRNFSYDYLIISLGAELAPELIPGLSKAAYNLYDVNELVKLREGLKKFSGGTVVVLICSVPFKCPAAPYEAALLLDYSFRERGIRDKVEIKIFTPEPLPMPTAGPAVGSALKQMLEERGIVFNPGYKIASVDAEKKELSFEKGNEKFDLLVTVPPHRAPAVVRKAGLAGEVPWIPVDKNTLKTQHDGVYAIGDVAGIRLPGRFKPDVPLILPKAGVFAHAHAEVVAKNIAAEIRGGVRGEFDGKGFCFIEAGYGMAGYGSGNFYTQPAPSVGIRKPGRLWRWGKALFEKYWFWKWF